jgi:hypothetical protein
MKNYSKTTVQNHQSRGSSIIMIFVALVTVAVIGAIGYAIFKHVHTTKNPMPSTSTHTTAVTQAPSTSQTANTTPPTSMHTSAEALTLVQTAYDTANAYVVRTTNAGQGETDAIKADLSPQLYTSLSAGLATADHDEILCDQAFPDSITAVLGSTSNGVATVLVNETYGKSTQQVTTTVDLSSLQITSIQCPAS